MSEVKRRTHTNSAMPVHPPPQAVARNLKLQKKKAAQQPGSMSVRELKETLKDYYAYHDPFKTSDDIELIVKWAKKRGIRRLNLKLKDKYGEDLVSKEEEYHRRSAVLSKLITPGLVEAYQQDDYDSDEEDAFSSISNQLQQQNRRSGVRDRTSSILQDSSLRNKVEAAINVIELSASPQAIRENLIKYYQLVSPERLNTPSGEDPAFLEEILTWTFRFGLPSLCNNLRVKYLGYDDMEADEEGEYGEEEGAGEGGEEEEVIEEELQGQTEEEEYEQNMFYGPTGTTENQGGSEQKNVQEIIEDLVNNGTTGRKEYPPPREIEVSQLLLQQPAEETSNGLDLDDATDEELGTKIKAFYLYYNPARVADGVEDVVKYVRKKGVDKLNAKLRGRYNDDLYTFFEREENQDTDYKVDLFERLFQFYSKHDPGKVGGGLAKIISWTERNGWEALNEQLQETYGADLL